MKGFIGFLLAVIGVAAVLLVVWVIWVNRENPQALLDPDRAGEHLDRAIQEARPQVDRAIDQASELAGDFEKKLRALTDETWGDDGFLKEIANWRRQNPVPAAPAAAPPETPAQTPAAPAEPAISSQTQNLAARLLEARETFDAGYEHYQNANPAIAGSTRTTFAEIKKAQQAFKTTKELLLENLDAYAARPDHDAGLLARSRALLGQNNRCLSYANKMCDR